MVAVISGKTRPVTQHGPRKTPYIVLLSILGVAAVITWGVAFAQITGVKETTKCTAAPQGMEMGEVVDRGGLTDITPATLNSVTFKVLNANGEQGQAGEIARELSAKGYTPGSPSAANDTIYASGDLACPGQIRFGPKGEAAALSLLLVSPCMEMVRDNRPGADVDIALGTHFAGLKPSTEGSAIIDQLSKGDEPDTDRLVEALNSGCN